MIRDHKPGPVKGLGPIEQSVLETLWQSGPATAEQCRELLHTSHPLKDSTIRTVLRRLEEKGYLQHEVRGRTYVYRPAQPRHSVVAGAVKQIVDRFCGGSVELLLLGMVDNEVLDSDDLERLARRIARRGDKDKEQKR